MTQSAKGFKSDSITTVIADTISNISTSISNVASNVSTLTTSVATVQTTITTIATPKISSISYVGDDTAADPAGGQTITLNGLNFATGATVLINNQPVSVVSVVDSSTITFTSPALAAGSYIVYVINTDGGTGISIPGIQYSGVPAWSTVAGSLGSVYETASISQTLSATGDAPVTYSLVSGTLPPGSSLNANGTITGTSQTTSSSTTYTFTIKASDAQNQDTNRQFSITINPDVVTWNSPSSGASILLDGTVYSSSLSAASAAGQTVSYTANALPTGLTLSSGTISGTPTVEGNVSTLLTATASTTNKSATNTITWVVSLGDSFWKYTTLLLNGSTPATTFINDASLNNHQLTIAGDTKPNNFSPYSNGYYSVQFNGTVNDYVSVPANSGLSIMSGSTNTFVAECWVYWTTVNASSVIMDKSGRNGVSFQNWAIELDASKQIKIVWGASGSPGTSTIGSITSTTIPVPGIWYHLAFVKSSADWSLFINGTRAVTFNGLNTANDANPGALRIGLGIDGEYNGGYMAGYISNVRIYNGAAGSAPYSATSTTITIPTEPASPATDVYAIVNQSSSYADKSSQAATITPGTGVRISSVHPYRAVSSSSGSAYFDGSGDYLLVPASTSLAFSGDYTIECWVYLNSVTGTQGVYSSIDNATDTWAGAYLGFNGTSFLATSYITAQDTITHQTAVAIGQWYHIAMVRSGSSTKSYLNGVQSTGTTTSTYSLTQSGGTIGSSYPGTGPLNGYISDLRVVNGTALYTASFTPPTSRLSAIAKTQLLTLQYNGGANNNGFVDQSSFNNIITRAGNTTQGTFSPYSQNGWSQFFNGSTDYITIPSTTTNFGTGAWTIELSFYITSLSSASVLFDTRNSGAGNNGVQGSVLADGSLYWFEGSSSSVIVLGAGTITPGKWYHLAFVRTSTAASGCTLYIDGVSRGTGTSSQNHAGYTTYIGRNAAGAQDYMKGYISNFRIAKSAIVPISGGPKNPVSATETTQFLSAISNRFVDSSLYNNTMTLAGTPSIQAFSPFGGVTSLPASYSNYFDGTGDYLTLATNAAYAIGSADFTIEMWALPTTSNLVWSTLFAGVNYGISSDWGLYAGDGTTSLYPMFFFTSSSTPGSGSSGTQGSQSITSYTKMTVGVWNHIAVSRVSGTAKMFLNGTQVGVSVNASTWSLTNVLQKAIAGGYNGNSNTLFTGNISNLRIVSGTGLYTVNFTPPTSPLTAVAGTILLTCQSSIMVDNSPNYFPITAAGDAKPKSFNPFGTTNTTGISYTPAVNGGSMYFDGTGDKLTIANYPGLAFGTNDFTIQAWFYTNVTSTEQVVMTNGWASYAPWLIRLNVSNQLVLNMSLDGGSWTVNEQVLGTVTTGQWYHVAITRTSGTLRAFFNGVQSYATSLASSLYNGSQALTVGGRSDTSVPFNGYLSDCQLINGSSLYSANFVPPVSPVTATGNTTLLLNGTSGGIIDYHGTSNLETVGDVKLTPEDPYSGSYYSNYFTTSANITLIQPALGNIFTIEMWVYPTATPSNQYYYVGGSTSGPLIGYNGATLALAHQGGWSVTSSVNPIAGQWNHVAVVREGTGTNQCKMYVNGVLSGTGTEATTFGAAQTGGTIGQGGSAVQGYISNLRITNNQALYTGAFTPATAPLTTSSVGATGANVATSLTGTVALLTCQSNKFIDNSASALTLTPSAVTVKSMNPFQQNTGKSFYFDGTGDNLYSPPSPSFNFGTKDFTVEFWVYPTASGRQDWVDLNNTGRVLIYHNGTNVSYYANPPNAAVISAGNTTINAWNHIAVSRSSGTSKLFINGVSVGSAADTNDFNFNFAVYVGKDGGGTTYMSGYIKDLRITKYARYTAPFTPPTTPMQIK